MQQSSATQSLHLALWGLRKIVACSQSSLQCLLVSTVFGMVSSLHPTSFLILVTITRYVVKWQALSNNNDPVLEGNKRPSSTVEGLESNAVYNITVTVNTPFHNFVSQPVFTSSSK